MSLLSQSRRTGAVELLSFNRGYLRHIGKVNFESKEKPYSISQVRLKTNNNGNFNKVYG
jgi:hypothetical protein